MSELSGVRLFATRWTIQSMEVSRPEYWSGWPFLSPGDLPNPGIDPRSPALQADLRCKRVHAVGFHRHQARGSKSMATTVQGDNSKQSKVISKINKPREIVTTILFLIFSYPFSFCLLDFGACLSYLVNDAFWQIASLNQSLPLTLLLLYFVRSQKTV